MLESAWLFTGALATITTLGAVLTTDDGLAILTGTLGFILWGLWAYGTIDLVVVADTTTYTYSMPELTIVGVAVSLLPAYIALTGPLELISRWRNPQTQDV